MSSTSAAAATSTPPTPGCGSAAWASGLAVVAVFPQLVEGRYDLLDAVGEPMLALTITGGRITELDLRQ